MAIAVRRARNGENRIGGCIKLLRNPLTAHEVRNTREAQGMLRIRRLRRWTGAIARPSVRKYQPRSLERIFLHVGVEKTGTTTLQVAMAVNRPLLHRSGYIIPPGLVGSSSYHIGLALFAANPDAVPELRQVARLTNGAAYSAFLESYPSQIARELTEPSCHTAVLSNEHCSSRLGTVTEIAKVHQIVSRLARDCRVIIYLRRQDEVVASHYSTYVRSGAIGEFKFPNDIFWLDYLHLLEMWAHIFGKENLIIRIFEPHQLKDGDLLSDFFTIIGLPQQDQLLRPENQNRSFDVYTVEFLRRFNAHLPPCSEGGPGTTRGEIDAALAAITTHECLRPSAEMAATFLNRFAASNAEVARRFLGREDGMLFAGAPADNQTARLPTLDVDKAVAISVALWQWQEARLHAALRNARAQRR
jgi:hypothetical protein